MDPVQLKRQEIPHKLSDQLCPVRAVEDIKHIWIIQQFLPIMGKHAKACDLLHHLGSPGSVPPCAGLQPPLGSMCYLPAPHAVPRFMCELQGKHQLCEEMKDLSPFSFFFLFLAFCLFDLLEKQSGVLENYQEFMQKRTVKSTSQP